MARKSRKNLPQPEQAMVSVQFPELDEEKMYSAIRQGAGRKAIEAVRAESSMQMKTILAELNMEQFLRVPLYESYMACLLYTSCIWPWRAVCCSTGTCCCALWRTAPAGTA